jgi:cytochrome P450
MTFAPSYSADLYGDPLLLHPYNAYREIRDLGSAVWLPQHEMWAIARFEDVRVALRADTVLISGQGVAANPVVNAQATPITLTSDSDTHIRRRQVLMQPVSPAPLKALREKLEATAAALVQQLATGDEFDAVTSFAAHLPVSIVAELVGLDAHGQQNMLRWAASTFNALGVLNARGAASVPALLDLGAYVQSLDSSRVREGGWAHQLFLAAERGDLSMDEARAMVIDYVGPALDTTILATAHLVWLLGTHPDAYRQLCAEPDLVPGIVNEAVRLASPIRGFTRLAAEDYSAGDTLIPKGQRVLILFASANHDERRYEAPDTFSLRRNPRDHVGWGHGAHTCVGMHLARLEIETLLRALIRNVADIAAGPPTPILNNVLQGFERLPCSFRPV